VVASVRAAHAPVDSPNRELRKEYVDDDKLFRPPKTPKDDILTTGRGARRKRLDCVSVSVRVGIMDAMDA
jgi:hypothetical protein